MHQRHPLGNLSAFMRDLLPKRHLFRKLRNYHQIWPFVEGEDDWWMEPSDPRPPKVEPLAIHPKSVGFHPADKYLDRKLHDARMIGVSAQEDSLSLRVDDYDVWRLSTAYEVAADVPRQYRYFPLTLEFRGLNAWTAYQINPLGHLSRLKHSLRSNLAKVHELAGDKVVFWDTDRVVAFFEIRVWPSRWTRSSWDEKSGSGVIHDHDLLIAIDAKELIVHEGQRDAWVTAYGTPAAQVFDSFWLRRSELAQGAFEPFEQLVKESLGHQKSES